MSHSGKRDKGKHEAQKKPAHTLKEKRKLKHEKKYGHPADAVERLTEAARAEGHHTPHN